MPEICVSFIKTPQSLDYVFKKLLKKHETPAVVPAVGTVFSILFANRLPRNYRDTLGANEARRRVLDTSLLARGIFVKPVKPFYLSTAYDYPALRQAL